MRSAKSCLLLAAAFVLCRSISPAQSGHPVAVPSKSRVIRLDVVVSGHKDAPVVGLSGSDFSILDNGIPQKITSFQPITGEECPVEVILVMDDVNTRYADLAYARQQMRKFLKANGGRLPYPTTLVTFSDLHTKSMMLFTRNGSLINQAIDAEGLGPRAIGQSAGVEGGVNRANKSVKLLWRLIDLEAPLPGRKLILWMSPGWPLLVPLDPEMSASQQYRIFNEYRALSDDMREGRVTLYMIDPEGIADGDALEYAEFLKPVRRMREMRHGDLSLQTFVVHSGGLVLGLSNSFSGMMQKVYDDPRTFYEITYDAPLDKPDKYHAIEIKVDKPGVKVRTTAGYYSGH